MFARRWAGWFVVGLATSALVAGCSPATTTPLASPAPIASASAAIVSTPTASDLPSPSPSPVTSASPGLVGVWAAEAGSPALTLDPCAAGEVCGRFERIDDNAEHCVYALEYRPPLADKFVYRAAPSTQSMSCAYSPWSGTDYYVRPMPDGNVEVSVGNGMGGVTLGAVDSPPAQSASPSVFPTGRWLLGSGDTPAVMEFRPDGTFTYTLGGQEVTVGTYATDSGTYVIKTDRFCKSVEGVEQATYSWTHVGDQLTLTKQSDSCVSRAGMLDGVVLRAAP